MELRRNWENVIDVDRESGGDSKAENTEATVGKERGVDQFRKVFDIVSCREFRDVADDGRADSEIEQSIITGNGKDERPDTERCVAEPVNDDGRQEQTYKNVATQRKPGRAEPPASLVLSLGGAFSLFQSRSLLAWDGPKLGLLEGLHLARDIGPVGS
jgi:hypothetical protein